MTNRFSGLNLVDRRPEELRMEVCTIVQEVVIEITLKKKKCEKAKWLSDQVLQIAEKRREAKGKRERKSHAQLNAVTENSKERKESLLK